MKKTLYFESCTGIGPTGGDKNEGNKRTNMLCTFVNLVDTRQNKLFPLVNFTIPQRFLDDFIFQKTISKKKIVIPYCLSVANVFGHQPHPSALPSTQWHLSTSLICELRKTPSNPCAQPYARGPFCVSAFLSPPVTKPLFDA